MTFPGRCRVRERKRLRERGVVVIGLLFLCLLFPYGYNDCHWLTVIHTYYYEHISHFFPVHALAVLYVVVTVITSKTLVIKL